MSLVLCPIYTSVLRETRIRSTLRAQPSSHWLFGGTKAIVIGRLRESKPRLGRRTRGSAYRSDAVPAAAPAAAAAASTPAMLYLTLKQRERGRERKRKCLCVYIRRAKSFSPD